jgi:hypothetical protein
MNEPDYTVIDKGYYFKFYNPTTDIKLIRFFLEDNGFIEFSASTTNHNTSKHNLVLHQANLNVMSTINGNFSVSKP